MHHTASMTKEMRKAIDDCMSCSSMCEETIAYCMDMPGSMMDAASMRILMDCAAITRVCSEMMCRMSPMHPQMCDLCARACTACADMAMKMSSDAQMKKLAEMCRTCADSCQMMAHAAA